jgi:hypothetical protein
MKIRYPDIQPFYRNVFNETVSDKLITKELEFARCFLEDWCGEFLHPLGDDLLDSRKLNSILYCYMSSQSLTFDWLCHTLMFGHYQNVLRELRTILENLFYMYSLDITHINKSVAEKFMEIEQLELRERELHGKIVFEKSGFADWRSNYILYRELCRYTHIHTHASAKLALNIAKEGFPEALDVKYDRGSFLQCSGAWRKVAKVSISLATDLCSKTNVEMRQFDPNYFLQKW